MYIKNIIGKAIRNHKLLYIENTIHFREVLKFKIKLSQLRSIDTA